VGLLQSHAPGPSPRATCLHPLTPGCSRNPTTALLAGARRHLPPGCCAMAPSVSCCGWPASQRQWRMLSPRWQSLAAMDFRRACARARFDVVMLIVPHAAASSYTLAGQPAPPCCSASPPLPNDQTARHPPFGFRGPTPPRTIGSRLHCGTDLSHDRMAPQRLCSEALTTSTRRRRPPAPIMRDSKQDTNVAHDAGPGLLRERGARPAGWSRKFSPMPACAPPP